MATVDARQRGLAQKSPTDGRFGLALLFAGFTLWAACHGALKPAHAEEATEVTCNAETDLQAIDLPALRKGCRSGTFHFAYRKPDQGNLPTVVYFGGGPNAPTLGTNPFPIPPTFGLLRFDYPGEGCNRAIVATCDWRAEDFAELALGLLKRHKLQQAVVYGVSYGSVPATMLASKLARSGYPARLLLLESPIGKAFGPAEVVSHYQFRWNSEFEKLPAMVKRRIVDRTGLACTSDEAWGAWVELQLAVGPAPGAQGPLAEFFNRFAAKDVSEEVCLTHDEWPKLEAESFELYRQVVCREINPTAPGTGASFVLRGDSLEPRSGNLCSDRSLDRPFDAAAWPLGSTEVVYFAGKLDPATPMAQADHHYRQQRVQHVWLVGVERAAHAPLSVTLSDCAEELFERVALAVERRAQVLIDGLAGCREASVVKGVRTSRAVGISPSNRATRSEKSDR